ncbi:hypothetical protein [Streptomyces klenkii]
MTVFSDSPTRQAPSPTSMPGVRSSGWIGIINLVLALAPLPLSTSIVKPFPLLGDSDQQIATYWAENQTLAWVQVSTSSITLALLLWQMLGLRNYLAVTGGRFFPELIAPSAVAVAATYLLTNALYMLSSQVGTTGYARTAESARLALNTAFLVFYISLYFVALLLITVGISVLQSATLPRWPAHFSFALAALHTAYALVLPLVHKGPFAPLSWLSMLPYILFWPWAAAIGVFLLRAARPHHRLAG